MMTRVFVEKFGEQPMCAAFFSFQIVFGGVPEGSYPSWGSSCTDYFSMTFSPISFCLLGGERGPPFLSPGWEVFRANTILQCLLELLLLDCFLDLCSSRRCIALLTSLGGCGSLWSLALLVGGSGIYHSFEGLLGTLENIKVGFFLSLFLFSLLIHGDLDKGDMGAARFGSSVLRVPS